MFAFKTIFSNSVNKSALLAGASLSLLTPGAFAQSSPIITSGSKIQMQEIRGAGAHRYAVRSSSHSVAVKPHNKIAHPVRTNRPWGRSVDDAPPHQVMPETQKLLNNDAILPGQNRTQAMALEAETGHINPQADAVLAPKRK